MAFGKISDLLQVKGLTGNSARFKPLSVKMQRVCAFSLTLHFWTINMSQALTKYFWTIRMSQASIDLCDSYEE